MGVRHVLADKRPDLVLSGVNRGANIAEDVTYSGTIAGALEGTQLGIRSLALSQAYGYDRGEVPRWETAIAHAPKLIGQLLAEEWPQSVLMNLNFPDCAVDAVAGVAVTRQGKRDQNLLLVDERRDTWGNPYYWLGFERRRSNPAKGTDFWAVYNGHISVTPLYMNLTHVEMHARLTRQLGAQIPGREPGRETGVCVVKRAGNLAAAFAKSPKCRISAPTFTYSSITKFPAVVRSLRGRANGTTPGETGWLRENPRPLRPS